MRQFIIKSTPWLLITGLYLSVYVAELLATVLSPANATITAGAYVVAVFASVTWVHHRLTTTPGGK